jgi:hypothetical protein
MEGIIKREKEGYGELGIIKKKIRYGIIKRDRQKDM